MERQKKKCLNFNVGILGHIDSGKTSLGAWFNVLLTKCHGIFCTPRYAAKALSSVASTASFDKNPQSRERGITLDLGKKHLTIHRIICKSPNLLNYRILQGFPHSPYRYHLIWKVWTVKFRHTRWYISDWRRPWVWRCSSNISWLSWTCISHQNHHWRYS